MVRGRLLHAEASQNQYWLVTCVYVTCLAATELRQAKRVVHAISIGVAILSSRLNAFLQLCTTGPDGLNFATAASDCAPRHQGWDGYSFYSQIRISSKDDTADSSADLAA